MKKEMLINVKQPEECRIAILENGVLEELYVERSSHESYVGNIYKGKIVNIEPSIQAAFVDFGVGRNGFLHVSDVEPAYYRHLEPRREERRSQGRRPSRPAHVSRPGVVIPPGDQAVEEEIVVAESFEEPDIQEGNNQDSNETANEKRPSQPFPPPLGIPTEISVVNELLLDESEWIEEDEDESDRIPDDEQNVPESNADEIADIEDEDTEKAGFESESGAGQEDDVPEYKHDEDDVAERGLESNEVRADHDETEEEPVNERFVAGIDDEEDEADSVHPLAMESSERRTHEEGRETDPAATALLTEEEREDDSTEDEFESLSDKPSDDDFSDEELSFSLTEQEEDVSDEDDSISVDETEEIEVQESVPVPLKRSRYPESRGDEDFERPRGNRRGSRNRSRDDDRRGNRDRRGRRNGGGRRMSRAGQGRPKPLIQDIFKKGQEVLVQVIKEGIGTKGPTLSTYISIAGRYLVLMPGLNRIGVSRKITDEDKRRRLRDILSELKPPRGLGFIIRTAGLDRTKKELQRDLAYLSRLWQVVARRIKKLKAPTEIYQESDMITRTIRDTFTSDIKTIWVDAPKEFEHAQEFLQIVMPRYASRIKQYSDSDPIFHKYGIEEEIGHIHHKTIPLRNGGSIVIEQTEALVAIDVNSGNFRADNNAEETAYQMNILAAREIARQLRLRDMGGVIVNDFIDMRDEKHRRAVEKALRDAVKRDRARTKILRMSQFGIIEMTRQRIRPSLKRSVYEDCTHCGGSGQVKTSESMSIDVMRMLALASHREYLTQIEVRVHEEVSQYLLNRKRSEINHLEESTGTQISISGVACSAPDFLEFTCNDNNGNEVPFPPKTQSQPKPRRRN